MFLRTLCSSVSSLVAAGMLVALAGNAQAACYAPQQALPAQTISAFTNNPGAMLQQYPSGGVLMISQIRDLAASDPATLPLIVQLIANANKDQKRAIGSALAQAAKICVKSPLGGPGAGPGGANQAYATQIQDAVAQTKDSDVILAYTAVTGEEPLGGVGAGPGGLGGGGGGGQTNPLLGLTGSTGGAQAIGGGSVPTGPFSPGGGVVPASGISTGVSTSVSP